jgi:hypothetical protein
MTKYLSAGFALAAALVGIVGDTHDSGRQGIAGITSLGWAAIGVAVLSFIVILRETYLDHRKIDWQVLQKEKVKEVANAQVVDAVMHFLNPFRVLMLEIFQRRTDSGIDLDKLDKSPTYVLGLLHSPTIRAEIESLNLRAKPNVYPPLLWWEYLSSSASEARELLNQAAMKYSGYLDSDCLVAIEGIRCDKVVSFLFPGLRELESANKQIEPLSFIDALSIDKSWASFDDMLRKFRKVIDQTGPARSPF